MLAVQTITDPESGASARILPSVGFNCFSFKPIVNGRPREILWSAPGFEDRGDRPSHSGIPILFPFAGRLRGQELVYGDRRFPLTLAQADQGHAIHGFVLNRTWRITPSSHSQLTGSFQASIDEPALLHQWPADFSISATYTVSATQLALDLLIQNPDRWPLPFSLGTHPYIRLPLDNGDADRHLIDLPATTHWPLDQRLPTGASMTLSEDQRIKDTPFGQLHLDDVFGQLIPSSDGKNRVRITDPASGISVVQTFDPVFEVVVAYIPPHREAISLEPQLSVPNAFELERQGIDSGLQVLAPNDTFTTRITIEVETGPSPD